MADQDPALEGQDNPERPEWLPDNFDSPEALAKSYTEAQRKITELSTQNKGLEESIGNLSAQFEQFTASQQPQVDPSTVYGQWQEFIEQDPVAAQFAIARQVADERAQQILQQQSQPLQATQRTQTALVAAYADQQLSNTYQDWDDVKGKVADFIQSQPTMFHDGLFVDPESAKDAVEMAYKMVKADQLLSGDTVVQQQMADTRQMKLNAQSAVGASGRPDAPQGDAQEWAKIMAARPKGYWEK